jgi:glycosyltransferase involved in cell wall biosynthesis
MLTRPADAMTPEVSILVPARNEEASLGACLESLLSQEGARFEVIVIDDGSTDRTREIAESFPGVRVWQADPLPEGWSGKCNALHTGVRHAGGEWLLFTDADTVHRPGSLRRALEEARKHEAAMLSYSPEQWTTGFWQKTVMPLVFAELARTYEPSRVSDPRLPDAAANGQYILMRRDAYDAAGGHAVAGECLLEDVALARAVKASGAKMRFRYGADAVATHMYRSFGEMWEGWTKNLATLFPRPVMRAVARMCEAALLLGAPAVAFVAASRVDAAVLLAISVFVWVRFLGRVRRAHFPWYTNLGAALGLPIFSVLLVNSYIHYRLRGRVAWKGRYYATSRAHVNLMEGYGLPDAES